LNQDTQLTVAIHILCLLASSTDADPHHRLTSEVIAGSVNTNPVVIRRSLGKLRRAGMVTSQGGSKGGWELVRPASAINLRQVFEAVRTTPLLLALHRNSPNPKCEVGAGVTRALTDIYQQADIALVKNLERITIADVLAAIRSA
jgi:DNA-binding IscR family transcriptional regulator